MNKLMAMIVLTASIVLAGCGNDLSVLDEVKGGTFFVERSIDLKPEYGKAFNLFVDELVKAGAKETTKREDADFQLTAGDLHIYLDHRRERRVWIQPWPPDGVVGFMENAREDASEFGQLLARKGKDPSDPDTDR